MSTNYTGSGSTIHTTIPLLDDSDRPAAQVWRQSFEPIIDSLAALDSGVSTLAIRTTGGTYTLSNDLIINGDEWHFAAIARVLSGATFNVNSGGLINVSSGGEINVQSGGTIDLDGTLDIGGDSFVRSGVTFTIRAGAELEVEDNGTIALAGDIVVSGSGNIILENLAELEVQSGAVASVASGGLLDIASGGTAQLARARDLKVAAESYILLLSLSPAFGSAGWGRDTSSPALARWIMTGAAGESLYFPITVPAGDVINSVVASFDGGIGAGHGGTEPGEPPIIQLVTLDLAGNVTVVAQVGDGTTGAAYDDPHDVTLDSSSAPGDMPYTTTGQPLYLRVFAEGPTGGVANTTVLRSVGALCVANSIRRTGGSTEFR